MAKKSKAKLPKTIAGVTVPKAVRTSGLLDELLNSQLGREILAEALVAAAGAVASVLMKKRPSADEVAQAGGTIVDTGAEPPQPQRISPRRLWEPLPRPWPTRRDISCLARSQDLLGARPTLAPAG